MSESTTIAWTHSTFNPWWGCTKISDSGCRHCYAEKLDRRLHGGAHWGHGSGRKLMSDAYWMQPLAWNRRAIAREEPHHVFCASMADVFDNEVPDEWRCRLWSLIRVTPALTWQIVTKRISNVKRMLPNDWGAGYPNVWLISTVVTQHEADRDIPRLLEIPAVVHGLSMEPACEAMALNPDWLRDDDQAHGGRIDWIIIGGESHPEQPELAAPFLIEWIEQLQTVCRDNDVALFVKQMGHNCYWRGARQRFRGKGDDINEWPFHLRQREFPTLSSLRIDLR